MKLLIYTTVLIILSISLVSWVREYNQTEATEYAIVSGLAYCLPKDIMNKSCWLASKLTEDFGVEPLYAYENDEDVNKIIYTITKREPHKEIIVAFSGTRNNQQFLSEIVNSYPEDYTIHPNLKGAKVIRYFNYFYMNFFRDDFEKQFKAVMKNHSDYSVVFTGHSLGAALTVLAAVDAILSKWIEHNRISVYTYGQPRVGNYELTSVLDESNVTLYRIINNRDPFPHAPPCIGLPFSYSCYKEGSMFNFYPYHHATEVWYRPNNNEQSEVKSSSMDYYTLCNTVDGEDSTCSNSVLNVNPTDHSDYFGYGISTLSKSGCVNTTIKDKLNSILI